MKSGIRLDRANGVLEVVAAGPEAVRLRLKEPVAYKGVLVREVVVDVLEPREFIDCIKERKRGSALIERMDTGKASAEPVDDAGEDMEEGPGEPEEEEPRPVDSAPPVRTPKAPKKPAPPPEPEEPEESGEEEDSLAVLPDEDEIEVVPALPATPDAQARVVRIPKRKE